MLRDDPTVFIAVGVATAVAIAATVAFGVSPSPFMGLAILVVGGLAAAVAIRRGYRGLSDGVDPGLSSDLPEHVQQALAEPPPPLDLRLDPSVDAIAERLAVGGCPRCDWRLDVPGGTYQQRDCARGCGSLILDSERLLVERAGLDLEVVRALVREQGAKKARCPSCSTPMHEGRLRGAVVDLCLSCGALWLDTGELDKLTRAAAFT